VKSLAVLAVAAAAFAYLLVEPYVAARASIEREDTAKARLLRLEPGEAAGYDLAWVRGDSLPDVLVARPEHPGADGPKWFATADGREIYDFDTVRLRVPPEGPDLRALRRFLALPPAERADARLPAGWERTVHSRP
jgi:hypothetical protein